MSKYIIDSSTLTDIADAIREESMMISTSILTETMATEIRNIQSGVLEITSNGQKDVKGIGTAVVNVPTGVFPSGTKSITANGTYDVNSYASAEVNVPTGITPTGSISITENGTFDVTSFASALVNVSGGGGGSYNLEVIDGEVELFEDATRINIPYSGNSPFMVYLYREDSPSYSATTNTVYEFASVRKDTIDIFSDLVNFTMAKRSTSTTSISMTAMSAVFNIYSDYIQCVTDSSIRVYRSGYTYYYYLYVLTEA